MKKGVNFATVFEEEISKYEQVRREYQSQLADKMNRHEWMEYNGIMFSAHSRNGRNTSMPSG